MTETGANLPEETLRRIEGEKEEAYRSEIRDIEARIAAGIDRHLEDRKKYLDGKTENLSREASLISEQELSELQKFEAETLKLLEVEVQNRRSERLKADEERRKDRIKNQEENATRAVADAEESRKKAEAVRADPAVRVRTLLKQIAGHMERGDMDMASKALSEGLELDAFNPELIDLDAKIREAREADTFGTPAAPTATETKEKDKSKTKKQKTKPKKTEVVTPGARPPAQKKFPAWILSTVAAVLILGAAAIVYIEYMPKQMGNSMTLAILPWSSDDHQPSTEIFAAALPEIVLKMLSRDAVPLDILGYSTIANLTRISADPVRDLSGLGYSHFLRGHLRGTNSAYTLHVELTDSAGSTLWSDDFSRDAAGIILVPLEISDGLGRYFGKNSRGTSALLEVKNFEAYFLYLKGLVSSHDPDGLDDAINSFNRSVALDSTLSESHAGLASALVEKYTLNQNGKTSLLEDAGKAAAAAITLAPTGSDGYLAMSRVLIEQHLYEDAMALVDSVSVFAPRDGRIPFLRGLGYFRSGRSAQALDMLQKAYRLDPRNLEILGQLAIVHQMEKSFERALWFRETAMYFAADSAEYLTGPISDIITLDPALRVNQSKRVTSACLKILEGDPWHYPTLYSLARTLQASGDVLESNTYFNTLESILRGKVKSKTADTRALMYFGLTLTRLGRFAEGLATGEAAAAADPDNAEAKYLLARIYSLQMYSPKTKTVDEEKKTKTLELLREALALRFDNIQLGSADLHNMYSHADIRSALTQGAGNSQ